MKHLVFSLILIALTNCVFAQTPALPVDGKLYDTDHHLINAHGAGILYYNNTWYLFGEIKKGNTWRVPNQSWEDYRVPAGGISCYSSKNLKSWRYEGVALSPVTGKPESDIDTGKVIERPKVIYNAKTKQFVMWMHVDAKDYSYSQSGLAVSKTPAGPYRYIGSVKPNGQMSRDMTLFKNDDGKAYLIYSSEQNNTMQICLLSDDYLKPTKTYSRILINRRREAPAMFKNQGKYYLITSDCTGWSPNAATYAVANKILGPYTEFGNPCKGPGANTTFESQSTYVVPLKDKNTYLFMADRWNKTDLEKSDYLWLPLTVNNGEVEIDGDKDNNDFEHGLTGWLTKGNVTIDKDNTHTGNNCARIAGGYVMKRMPGSPLSIVSFDAWVKTSDTTIKAWSFIRFLDKANKQLLIYKSGPVKTTTYQQSGNYTESPPGTKYIEIGIERDSSRKGYVYADDFTIETNAGEPKVKHQPLVDLNNYMRPFWKSDTIYNETILLYAKDGAAADGKLLYNPDKIVSVRKFDLQTTYQPVTDYTISGNVITKTANSAMPFRADTSFDTKKDLAWFNTQSQWIVVTYTHHDKWDGPVPAFKGGMMPNVMAKLKAKAPLKIVALGMSITRGMDVSGYDDVKPYMPTYVSLFTHQLKKAYHYNNITLFNAGLPGAIVDWGAQYADKYINPLKPDLVIIDFGMNDFWRYTPEQFKGYIQTIISKVKAGNPRAEFLLLSNMKFDPDYVLDSDKNKTWYQANMVGYSKVLQAMEAKGVINLDMTSISDHIYHCKKAKDCIANPLHPNDYMARWYAQGMAQLLISN